MTTDYIFVLLQDKDLLTQWVSPRYLSISTQGTIQEQFEGTSEIQLPDFLLVSYIVGVKTPPQFWDM